MICSSHYYVIVFSSYCNCFSCCIVWLDFQSWIFTSGEKGRAQAERLCMHSDEADSCERPAPPNWSATKSHYYDDKWMPWILWFECCCIMELFEFNFCSFIKNYYFVILQIGNAAVNFSYHAEPPSTCAAWWKHPTAIDHRMHTVRQKKPKLIR